MEERDRGEEEDDEGEEHDQGRHTLPPGNVKVLMKMVLLRFVMVMLMRGKNNTQADIHIHLARSMMIMLSC